MKKIKKRTLRWFLIPILGKFSKKWRSLRNVSRKWSRLLINPMFLVEIRVNSNKICILFNKAAVAETSRVER